jgi:hypothetical protein
MSILRRLFAQRQKPARCAIVVGNGQFLLHILSNAQQRVEIERLCATRNEGHPRFPALLIPQPINAHGRDTVAVRIGDVSVGYLYQTTALEFLEALRAYEFDRAACGAMISIRPEPQLGDQAFRVDLDALVPFKLIDPTKQPPKDHKQADDPL